MQVGSGVCSGDSSGRGELLIAEKASLECQLREEEEKLRKLKMVKMYRTKVPVLMWPCLQATPNSVVIIRTAQIQVIICKSLGMRIIV